MPLPDFDFSDSASGEIAAIQLEPGCQGVLCHTCLFTQTANILPDFGFNKFVHTFTVFSKVLDIYDTDTIICGGAKGIDAVAEQYADEHGIRKIVIRPQYERYRKAAPLKRNEPMVDMADEVLVVWDGVSKGTAYTVSYAEKQGKTVRVSLL